MPYSGFSFSVQTVKINKTLVKYLSYIDSQCKLANFVDKRVVLFMEESQDLLTLELH